MNRNRLNFLLDLVSTLVVLALTFTGFLLFWVLPAGSGGRRGGAAASLWGWTRHDFGDFHFYLALGFVVLVVVHVWLHWAWVCTTFARICGGSKVPEHRRTTYGIAVAAAIVLGMVLALFWAGAQVQTTAGRRGALNAGLGHAPLEVFEPAPTPPAAVEKGAPAHTLRTPQPSRETHEENHLRGNNVITGQTTLAEAAQRAGLSAHALRQQLGLPAHVDIHERLGRLKRQYGFDIYAVRDIIDNNSQTAQQ